MSGIPLFTPWGIYCIKLTNKVIARINVDRGGKIFAADIMHQQAGVGDAVDVFAGDFQIINRFGASPDFDGGDADDLTKRRAQSFAGLQLFGMDERLAADSTQVSN